VFAASGALFATWVSRLPAVRDRLSAGEAELGLALLAPAAGALVSMPLAGRLCQRVGGRRVIAAVAPIAAALLVALGAASTTLGLGATLFAFGLNYGAWDVAMNVHGSAVDRQGGRDWMPRYHACWSAGGLAGAALGALAARAGVAVLPHFALAAVATTAVLLGALRGFLPAPSPAAPAPPAPPSGEGRPARPVARLAALGTIAFCATSVEGAASDWLALFFTDARGASASSAAAAYAAFATAMAAGRFGGTAVNERFGRDGAAGAAGLVTIAGIALTVFGPAPAGAFAGVALWGLGVSLLFPAAISAGGEASARAAEAIAAVSTVGYGGFLLGPPLLGLLAARDGLARALLALLAPAAVATALAPALRRRAAAPP
jgi:MFS family permease